MCVQAMPGRGPAPKRERSRPNDTARREAEFTRVADDGQLRGPELPESDSSAAAPAVIQTAAAELGFDVDVHYNTPLRVGLARAGSRLGALNGVLHVVVNAASSPLRAGLARVGDRLVNRTLPEADLACHLERLVPARFSINIVYD